MNIAFDSDDCRLFAQALDHAWDIFLKAGGLTTHNLDTAKASLTYAIFTQLMAANAAREGWR
jgi:hypothetical protein